MAYRRPSTYSYPPKFNKLEEVSDYVRRLYAELLENDSRGEEITARATDKDLKALIVRPEWYGAKRDGTTNDSAAIQFAVDACSSGGTVMFSAGTYLINTKIEIHHPVNLIGQGRDTIIKLNAPAWPNNMVFDLLSDHASSLNVTDIALTVAQQTITLDSVSGLSAGQTVLLLYGEDPYDANEEFLRVFLKIKTIAGNNVTFYTGIPEACNCGDVHAIKILEDIVEGVRLSGFAFDYVDGTVPNNYIRVFQCRNIQIDNIFAIRNPGILMGIEESENIHAKNIYLDDQTLGHSNALSFFFWGNRNCSLRNVYGKNMQNCFVFAVESQERNLEISDCYFDADNPSRVFLYVTGGSLNIRITNLTVNLLSSYVFDSITQASDVSYYNLHIYGPTTTIFAENVKDRITYNGTVYENPARATIYFKLIAGATSPYSVPVPTGTYKMVRVYVSSTTGITGMWLLAGGAGGDISGALVSASWETMSGVYYHMGSTYGFNNSTAKTLSIYTDGTVPDDAYGMIEIDYWPASDSKFPSTAYHRYFVNGYGNKIVSGTAVPTGGTWAVGDQVLNIGPADGEASGWICTSAGTPGTWVVNGYIGTTGTPTYGATTVSGLLTLGDNLFVPNGKKIYSKTTGDVESDIISLWTDNALYIGFEQDDIIFRGATLYGREKARIDKYANFHLGPTYAIGTGANRVMYLENATVPSTSPANKFGMYSKDSGGVDGKAGPHFRCEDGTVIDLQVLSAYAPQDLSTTAGPTFDHLHLTTGPITINGTQVVGAQALTQAALKADYTTGDLDSEAEVIAAINATNTAFNSLLAKLKTHGLIASA